MVKEIYEFNPDDAYRFANEQNSQISARNGQLHFQYCPYCHGGAHHDKDTFAIDLKTGKFKCLRSKCGASGNMITLSKHFNFSLGAMVDEYLYHKKTYRRLPQRPPVTVPAAVEYMQSRGISKEISERYNIGTKKNDDTTLVFPFFDENNILLSVKYRKTNYDKSKDKNKEWFHPNGELILFGMNHCNLDNKTLVMTEGQIDSLSLAQAGIENAVSVPNGAKGFTWIPNCWAFLVKFDELIVFGDHENGHITLLDEMKTHFRGTVKYVQPEDYKDCKDANEILQKFGVMALRDAVENAKAVENPRIIRMFDIQDIDLERREQFLSGFKWLDRMLGGFYFGQLIVVTGERGKGKSTFVSQLATFAVDAGYKTFFYSGEMNEEEVKKWFKLQAAGDKNIKKIDGEDRGYFYSVNSDAGDLIDEWLKDKAFVYNNKYISEEDENEAIQATMECAIRQYGCRVLITDNLMSMMIDDIEADLNRQQTAIVRSLALMAKQYDVLIFLIAHPRKSNGGKITNDSISGSGNITNLADVVLQYGTPPDNSNADSRILTVLKNRLTGRTDFEGKELYFQESSKRISERSGKFDWKIGWEDQEKTNEEWAEMDDDFLFN